MRLSAICDPQLDLLLGGEKMVRNGKDLLAKFAIRMVD